MNVFLSARWENLVNLTYAIDPDLLKSHVPPGTTLDLIDGKAFVSLVAFEFLDTRVKGIKIPFHVNFPEINLRFYVSCEGRRGVAFIREYVPKFAITTVANLLYNEPYLTAPMQVKNSGSLEATTGLTVLHTLTKNPKEPKAEGEGGKKQHRLEAVAGGPRFTPETDSIEHFFKEHDLGFGVDHSGKTLFYVVEHPVWECVPLLSYHLDFDFETVYGKKWAFLKDEKPHAALFAIGSQIKVFSPHPLSQLNQLYPE